MKDSSLSDGDSSKKVYRAMRSLYRLAILKKGNSPDILMDTEKTLLKKHLAALNTDEILQIALTFNKFAAEQEISDALADHSFFEDLERQMNSLN